MGKKIEKVKVKKLVGQRKDNIIRKAKQGIHSLFLTGRQMFPAFPGKQGSIISSSYGEDKCHNSECCPTFSFPTAFIGKYDITWYGISLWLGSTVPDVSPPSVLCIPSIFAGGTMRKTAEGQMLLKHCSAITKTSLCCQCWFGYKSKT